MSDYNKFKEIYDEIDELIGKRVDSSTPEFQAWKVKTERFLIKKYGEKSYELNNFRGYPFSLTLYTFDTTKAQFIEACAEDLKAVKAIFANYLEDMQEDNSDFEKDARKNISANNYKKVFIVHGHDAELKEATARLIERQGIKPIILHEQANKGATIIEKIEAIVMFKQQYVYLQQMMLEKEKKRKKRIHVRGKMSFLKQGILLEN